jgi:hypothetical protein
MANPRVRSVLLSRLNKAPGSSQGDILDEVRRCILDGEVPPGTAIPVDGVAATTGGWRPLSPGSPRTPGSSPSRGCDGSCQATSMVARMRASSSDLLKGFGSTLTPGCKIP